MQIDDSIKNDELNSKLYKRIHAIFNPKNFNDYLNREEPVKESAAYYCYFLCYCHIPYEDWGTIEWDNDIEIIDVSHLPSSVSDVKYWIAIGKEDSATNVKKTGYFISIYKQLANDMWLGYYESRGQAKNDMEVKVAMTEEGKMLFESNHPTLEVKGYGIKCGDHYELAYCGTTEGGRGESYSSLAVFYEIHDKIDLPKPVRYQRTLSCLNEKIVLKNGKSIKDGILRDLLDKAEIQLSFNNTLNTYKTREIVHVIYIGHITSETKRRIVVGISWDSISNKASIEGYVGNHVKSTWHINGKGNVDLGKNIQLGYSIDLYQKVVSHAKSSMILEFSERNQKLSGLSISPIDLNNKGEIKDSLTSGAIELSIYDQEDYDTYDPRKLLLLYTKLIDESDQENTYDELLAKEIKRIKERV